MKNPSIDRFLTGSERLIRTRKIHSHNTISSRETESDSSSLATASRLARMKHLFVRLFSIDLRALATLRIVMATILLLDLAIRSTALVAHYTDLGVLPRPARVTAYEYAGESSAHYWWSIHMMNGSGWFQMLLFLAAAWFAVWLLVGYRTRLATFLCWFFLVSLHSRLPSVVQGGDVLLRLLLFWSMFAPLGAVWSIDRRRDTSGSSPPRSICNVATVCLLLQPAIMYWFAAYAKIAPVWTSEYSAIYYALELDLYAKPWGVALRAYPQLLRAMTIGTYWLEWIGPAFAFVPWRTGFWRMMVVAVFWMFHLGLTLTMHLGFFSYVSMAAWLVFLPSGVWDYVERLVVRCQSALHLGNSARLAALGQKLWRAPAAPYRNMSKPAAYFLAIVLMLDVVTNGLIMRADEEGVAGPAWAHNLVSALHLEQEWFLFAPRPPRDDGWCLMRGVLVDGTEVNLWQPDEPLPWEKPELISAQFPNHRWRKLITGLCWSSGNEELSCLSDWLRWRWNASYSGGSDDRQVQLVEIVFYRERTPPPGEATAAVEPLLLWNWDYVVGRSPDKEALRKADLPDSQSLP